MIIENEKLVPKNIVKTSLYRMTMLAIRELFKAK